MRDPELSALSRVQSVGKEVREYIEQVVFRLARRAILAVASQDGDDSAEGYQVASTDPQTQHAARKFQHYGFRSRPPVGSEIIALSLHGKTSNRVYIASEAAGTGPTSQEEDEVEIYSKYGHSIALQKTGRILFVDAGGAEMTWHNGRLYHAQDVYTGSAPLPVPSSADLTITSVSGADSFFEVTFAVVNQITKGSALFTATFASAYPSAPLSIAVMRVGGKKITWSVTASDITLTADENMAVGSYTVVFHTGGLG